jgi:hypothetical protein
VLTTRNHVDIQILTRAGEVGFTILIWQDMLRLEARKQPAQGMWNYSYW